MFWAQVPSNSLLLPEMLTMAGLALLPAVSTSQRHGHQAPWRFQFCSSWCQWMEMKPVSSLHVSAIKNICVPKSFLKQVLGGDFNCSWRSVKICKRAISCYLANCRCLSGVGTGCQKFQMPYRIKALAQFCLLCCNWMPLNNINIYIY